MAFSWRSQEWIAFLQPSRARLVLNCLSASSKAFSASILARYACSSASLTFLTIRLISASIDGESFWDSRAALLPLPGVASAAYAALAPAGQRSWTARVIRSRASLARSAVFRTLFFSRSHFMTDQVVASFINALAVSTSGIRCILTFQQIKKFRLVVPETPHHRSHNH